MLPRARSAKRSTLRYAPAPRIPIRSQARHRPGRTTRRRHRGRSSGTAATAQAALSPLRVGAQSIRCLELRLFLRLEHVSDCGRVPRVRAVLARRNATAAVSGRLISRGTTTKARQTPERDPAERDPAERDPAERDPAERDPAERDPPERRPPERHPWRRRPARRRDARARAITPPRLAGVERAR